MARKYGQQFPAHAYDPATSRIYLSDSGSGPMGWLLADDLPFQPLDADLTAIAALATDAFGRSLLEQATPLAVRNLIGAGATSANLDQFADVTQTSGKTLAITDNTTLAGGSHSGTNTGDQDLSGLQPLDGTLTALAALTIAANSLTIGTAADTFQQTTFAANTFPARASTGHLVAKPISDFALTMLDDADGPAVRATIGAGDVTKVGTPATNQVAYWTGDGTQAGSSLLTYDGSILHSGVPGPSLNSGQLYVTGVTDGTAFVRVRGAGTTGSIGLSGERSYGTIAAPTAVTAVTNLFQILGFAYGDTAFQVCGSISIRSDGTISDTSAPGGITCRTTPSGATATVERFFISSTGQNEARGTTGGILGMRRVDTSVAANDVAGQLNYWAKDGSTTTNEIVAQIEAQCTNTIATDINPGRLIFRTTPTGVAAALAEAMQIDNAQRVGIGTGNTISAKLQSLSTTAFSKTSTGHAARFGDAATGKNLVAGVRSTDGAGIAALDNGNTAVLYLNPDGGNVKVGGPLYSDEDLIAANGKNVRVGAATVGTSGTNCLAIASGTAPGTNPDACFRATGGEMYVRDTSGNETLLSPHRADGPPSLYDFPGLDRVQPSAQNFVGEIEWINVSRLARKVDELTKGKNPCYMRESFDDYNQRLKLNPGDADLQVMIYQEDHDAAVAAGCALSLDAAAAKVKRWKERDFTGELSTLPDVPHYQPRPLFKWAKKKGS